MLLLQHRGLRSKGSSSRLYNRRLQLCLCAASEQEERVPHEESLCAWYLQETRAVMT